MKKIILKKISLALSAALILGQNVYANEKNWFAEVEVASVSQEKDNIFGAQPIDEIVGDKTVESLLKIGLTSANYDTSSSKLKGYAFVWKANVNNEIGFGIGGEYGKSFSFMPSLGWTVGGQIGYGWQPVKGDTKYVSTDATKYGYITGRNVHRGRYKIEMTRDTSIIRSDLTLGLTYVLNKKTSLGLKYRLSYGIYEFTYVHQSDGVYNSLSEELFSHEIVGGLTIHF